MQYHLSSYMQNHDPADWQKVKEIAAKLIGLYADLTKLALTTEDQQRIARAAKATDEFLTAAQAWIDNDTKLRTTTQAELKRCGETMVATAQAVQSDAWRASDENASAVASIVASSKWVIVLAQLVGMAMAIAVGIYLSRGITKVIRTLINEAKRLSEAAVQGKLQTRGNLDLVGAEFRPIIDSVNTTLDTVVAMVDRIPSPVITIGKDFTVHYINDVGSSAIGLGKDAICGTKCYDHFKTPHCQTAQCACQQAMDRNELVSAETTAHPGGNTLDISYSGVPLRNTSGKVVGAFELVTDLTAVKSAERTARKVAEYQSAETSNLTKNLERLANGNLNITVDVAEGDADTASVRESFTSIGGSLEKAIGVLRAMTQDARALSEAAAQGQLDTRADEIRYKGEYRAIIHGMNASLEGFATPLADISQTLQRLADKDFTQTIDKQYPGAYGELRDNVNLVVTSVRSAISQITESANQFAEALALIAESSQTLAQGADAKRRRARDDGLDRRVGPLGRSGEGERQQRNQVANQANQLARGRQGGAAFGRIDGTHSHQFAADQRDHPGDFGDRQPNEFVGLERGHRGGPGRRTRHGLCGGGRRGPQVGGALEPGGPRDLDAHQGIDDACGGRRQLSDQTGESLKEIIKAAEGTAAKIAEIAAATDATSLQRDGGFQGDSERLASDRAIGGGKRADGFQQRGAWRAGGDAAYVGRRVHCGRCQC